MIRTLLKPSLTLLLLIVVGRSHFVQAQEAKPTAQPLTAEQQKLAAELVQTSKDFQKTHAEGKFDEALMIAEKGLATAKKLLGPDHPSTLSWFRGIADEQLRREDYQAARQTQLEIHAVLEKKHGKEHWEVIDAKWDVAETDILATLSKEQRQQVRKANQLSRQGLALQNSKPNEALTLLQEALNIDRNVLGENHPKYASSLFFLGSLYHRTGEHAKAEPLYLQTKELTLKMYGESHPNYAHCVNNLAGLYLAIGENSKAETLYLKSKEIRLKVLGENHHEYAASLANLAQLYKELGENSKAEALHLKAKEIRLKVLGGGHPEYAQSLHNLAALYEAIGEYAKAEPLLLQAKEIQLKVLGKNHPDYASSLNSLAKLYMEMGEHNKAEPLLRQAKEIQLKVYGENHPGLSASLHNLASVYHKVGENAKAEQLYLQAKEIHLKVLGENHSAYATILNNLAVLYEAMGEYAKAEQPYLQAKEIHLKVFGENHPNYAGSLNNLAVLYCNMGEYAKAESLHLQAKEIRLKVLGENHPDYAVSLYNLAFLYYKMGENAKSETLFSQAVAIIASHLEQTAEIQTEASQLATASQKRIYWDNLLFGTAKQRSTAVYEPLFRLRGAITMRQIFLRSVRQSKPEAKPLVEELQRISSQMSQLVNNSPDPKLKVDTVQSLADLHQRYEQKQREIADQSDAFKAYQARKKATVADLQKLLPEDAVLIDFLGYRDQLCAFVVNKSLIQRIELQEMKPIAEAIDRFREQLKRSEPLTGKADDPALLLRDRLWQPLTQAIGPAKLVLICPDGPLCRLPFAALPGSDPNKYLIEEISLVTIPVPKMLFEILSPRPENSDAPSLFAMGDIDFDEATALDTPAGENTGFERRRAGGTLNWPALPGTRDEVIAISDSFKTAIPNGQLLSLRGKEATDANIRSQLGQYEFVHLATHGFFAPQELNAKLKLSNEDQREISGERTRAPGLNPGLLSGLVCAGANKPTENSDGVLTAIDIAELDLTKVELAVLSACETGLGDTAGGEGVLGLQRAFQLAGTRTTVTSLWKVSDVATQKLMTRFYENKFKRKQGTLEALREAQLWMLQEGVTLGLTRGLVRDDEPLDNPKKTKRAPPFYWAAFSLAGDWR